MMDCDRTGFSRRPTGVTFSNNWLICCQALMLDHLLIWVNGQRHEVRGREAFLSLSDYLRRVCGLTGTKIVCSEGDCGACSVLIGRLAPDGSRLVYRPVDSCIQFMFQLDGTHIVTIEG